MEKNVKSVDLFRSYDNMENKRILEERLRKAACVGDTDVVQELLNLGVDVNARHSVNGWTPLHWACKKGYLDVAALLLKNGADKNIRSEIGETPAFLCINPQILQLLDMPLVMPTDSQRVLNESAVHNVMPKYVKSDYVHGATDSGIPRVRNNGLYQDELVLKIRIADAPDPDFIEIELPQSDLTYQALIWICCQELNVEPNQIVKLRKLPNTRLRKDEDIQRLQNFQEIEVVTNTVNTYKYMQNTNGISTMGHSGVVASPANGYQSISKKDQTILY
ncbi:ankyrin repeat domain-containing protein 40-like [Bombus vosnesenskii]|uniref:Ankyrin repeat domain-containing protein 40-like n=3 Tax=Pyrobombus TaxID=144703 RepID=A0A6J3KD38_9HYME|nr:ankyrin repeat domain-containing protein 40 [Bombus impatiens]XP_033197531.1 ankyrin repeat domain-containing protein 40-like [Bombus vancouverensis nearcticus]XP_033306553.1 ankyrin repeat domain-containing protein 40-like [Bombus bifarius]XP_033350346.1 ankyrin repeat domain-containing protein 40-like [Bombus vosnesenskii]